MEQIEQMEQMDFNEIESVLRQVENFRKIYDKATIENVNINYIKATFSTKLEELFEKLRILKIYYWLMQALRIEGDDYILNLYKVLKMAVDNETPTKSEMQEVLNELTVKLNEKGSLKEWEWNL